jgi:hypothetical protein
MLRMEEIKSPRIRRSLGRRIVLHQKGRNPRVLLQAVKM